jgi:hypothetical protein
MASTPWVLGSGWAVRKNRAGKPRISLLSVKIDSHLVFPVITAIRACFPEANSCARVGGSSASVPEGSGFAKHAHIDREGFDGEDVP